MTALPETVETFDCRKDFAEELSVGQGPIVMREDSR